MKVIAKSANSQWVSAASESSYGRDTSTENSIQHRAAKAAIPNLARTGM